MNLPVVNKYLRTVVMWNRLEGRPRTTNFDRAMKAEVRLQLVPIGTRRQGCGNQTSRCWIQAMPSKLKRQAKPDDVFTFVTLAEITALFPLVNRYLGRSRDFWTWLLSCWKALPSATQ